MRISDWSSDVCSSDLAEPGPAGRTGARWYPPAPGAAAMNHDDHHHERHPPGAGSGPGAGAGNIIDRHRITGDRTMQPRAHALRQAIMLALAGTALTLASVAYAQQRAFDIPANDAVAALPEYARQAGVQIGAPGEQLMGLRTAAVKGTMDARVELRQLMADKIGGAPDCTTVTQA